MDTFPKIAESVVLEHQIAELMAEQKTRTVPTIERKSQILPVVACNTKLYHKRAMHQYILKYPNDYQVLASVARWEKGVKPRREPKIYFTYFR